MSQLNLSTTFPDRDACFDDPTNVSSPICYIPSRTMVDFLNITTGPLYWEHYCVDPPPDSCPWGYCPNPDVASPAVRYSAYFVSLVSAILVLYSPEDVESSFFAQLLNVYSLIIAAMVAIYKRNLTRFHSLVALMLAASPLSVYLLLYVIRSLFGRYTRLDKVFGKGKYLNRVTVILAFPIWLAVLAYTAIPSSGGHFQQAACDSIPGTETIVSVFFLPFIIFINPLFGGTLVGLFLLVWGTAIFRLRKKIWEKHNKIFPLVQLWRQVVDHYPFIHFCTVIVAPHFIWIFNVEVGILVLSAAESFSATYGQLLAIFVTVPPFIQMCKLLPRVSRWFVDLAWVRFLTCRRNKPRSIDSSNEEYGIPLKHGSIMSEKYDSDGLHAASDTGDSSVHGYSPVALNYAPDS
ncbi:hypothetical protein MVEN_02532500 [Mycena venus]|uniref:Uncharacterized protein n=1 Tax=Mycena venus TaxID=2733690 RepID=A0A8H6WUU8_9AGAR|nr:hypothetical protein MVEN_02532500 [Mycena venus]